MKKKVLSNMMIIILKEDSWRIVVIKSIGYTLVGIGKCDIIECI